MGSEVEETGVVSSAPVTQEACAAKPSINIVQANLSQIKDRTERQIVSRALTAIYLNTSECARCTGDKLAECAVGATIERLPGPTVTLLGKHGFKLGVNS